MLKILKYRQLYIAFIASTLMISFTACKSKQPVATVAQESPTPLRIEVSRFSQAEQMMIDNVFLEGVKQMMIEDYATAINVFLDVLRMDHLHAPANFQISKIRLMQNQLSDAEVYAERATRLDPQNKFYQEHLAYIYRENHKYAKAISTFERLIQLDPRNDDHLYEIANTYLMYQKPQEAIRIYDSIEKRYGVSDEISMQKIKIYQAIGKDANVRDELQKLIQRFPNETSYRAIRAELNMRAKKYKEAFADYQDILSIAPEDPYIHLSLADYYKITKDSARALSEMILAFQNPRLDVDAKVVLVLPYYEYLAQKEATYAMLDAILSAHPADPKALALYADFLQRDERYADARDKYREVIQLDASKYLIWEALLICDLGLVDTAALLRDAREAMDLFPEQPLVYYMLGTAYSIKNEHLMAMQYFEQGARLAQSNPRLLVQFYSYLGDTYHQLENHAKSDQNYRKALEIDPKNFPVLNNFSYYLSLRKEHLEEAEEMARLVCQNNPRNPTYLDTFAWVLYQRGKYAEAKSIMELALKSGGDAEAVLLEHYGDILWKAGDKERALEFWKQAKTLDEQACSEWLNEKIKTKNLIEN